MEKFKIGDMVIGENNVCFQKGEIINIMPSMGARKELIYNVGINWFFADELRTWYDGKIKKIIGADVDYIPNKVIKFTHDGVVYTIKAIKYYTKTEWCYLKVDKINGTNWMNENERGIGFYALMPKQIERIYNKIFS